MSKQKKLSPEQEDQLLNTLKTRFEENMNRHKDIEWKKVEEKLKTHPEKLWSLNEMEESGGEPDVVGFDKKTSEYIFYDCSGKVLKDAAAFVTTGKHWNQGKSISPRTVPWIWRAIWGLNS